MPPKLKVQQKTSVALTAAVAVSVFAVGFAAAAILLNIKTLKTKTDTRPVTTAVSGFNACLCGNGSVEIGETCDDGNRLAGDGCGVNCTRETTSVLINGRQVWPACSSLTLTLRQSASVKIKNSHSLTYIPATSRDASDAQGILLIDRTRREPAIANRAFVLDDQTFKIISTAPLVVRLGSDHECVLKTCSMSNPRASVSVATNFETATPDIVLNNTPEVTIARYEFKTEPGTSEAALIKTITFAVNTSTSRDDLNGRVFRRLKIYNGSTQIGSIENPSDNTYYPVQISDLGLTVPANGGKATITIKGDAGLVDGVNIKNGDGFMLQLAASSGVPVTGEGQISHNPVEFTNTWHTPLPARQLNIYSSYPNVSFSNDTPDGEFYPSIATNVAKLDLRAGNGPNALVKSIKFDLKVTAANNAACSIARTWTLRETAGSRILAQIQHNLQDGTLEFNLTQPIVLLGLNSTTTEADIASGTPAPRIPVPTKKLSVYANTLCLTKPADRLQLRLLDDQPQNFIFSFNVPGNTPASAIDYNKADVVFRGDIFGDTLMR